MSYLSGLYDVLPERVQPLAEGLYYTFRPNEQPQNNAASNAQDVYPDNEAPFSLPRKHLKNTTVVPDRYSLLDAVPADGRVAELGVNEGDFSEAILERTSPETLFLVDPWASQRYGEEKFQAVKERFADGRAADSVRLERVRSDTFLEDVEPGFLDWVYIDTTHSYEQTRTELVLAADAVRDDGIIAGHDYTAGNPPKCATYGVIPAVHEFCVSEGWEMRYITLETPGHNSFALTKL